MKRSKVHGTKTDRVTGSRQHHWWCDEDLDYTPVNFHELKTICDRGMSYGDQYQFPVSALNCTAPIVKLGLHFYLNRTPVMFRDCILHNSYLVTTTRAEICRLAPVFLTTALWQFPIQSLASGDDSDNTHTQGGKDTGRSSYERGNIYT